jgi:two-component system LytT family sensor kinase
MKKSVLIISHFLFWVFTVRTIPYLFMMAFWMLTEMIQHPTPWGPHKTYTYVIDYPAVLIFTVIGAYIFYASYFSLNFFVKRPVRFTWIALFYLVCSLVISLPADLVSEQAGMELGPILYFNLCGFLFKACVEWFNDRKIRAELEKDRETSQLELLKSKIDPHFLFNNLNNIDVFIQEDPKLASDYLKKLSDILRFMLYEANTAKIPLIKEIEYIRKYIDLQKIRTSNVDFVKFEINGDPANKLMSPMILIHFIENAFKHAGNKKIEDAVTVGLDVSEKRLLFYCKNHISSTAAADPAKNGLGIYLLKQKLDLLYKKEYTLVTKEENNWYIVNLDIPLDED